VTERAKEFESAGKGHARRGLEMAGGFGWEAGIRTRSRACF
jgi:hypothetical protein